MFLSHSFRFELPISTFSVSLELKMHDLHCQNILWLQFLNSNFHLGIFPSTPFGYYVNTSKTPHGSRRWLPFRKHVCPSGAAFSLRVLARRFLRPACGIFWPCQVTSNRDMDIQVSSSQTWNFAKMRILRFSWSFETCGFGSIHGVAFWIWSNNLDWLDLRFANHNWKYTVCNVCKWHLCRDICIY